MPEILIEIQNRANRQLIPDGEYVVQFVSHKITNYRGLQKKICMTFKLIGGQHDGKLMEKFYNASISQEGRISAGWGSDLIRDIVRIDGDALSRADRISLNVFKDVLLKARIVTVTTDHRRDSLPNSLRYSKIEAILGVFEGGDSPNGEELDDEDIPF